MYLEMCTFASSTLLEFQLYPFSVMTDTILSHMSDVVMQTLSQLCLLSTYCSALSQIPLCGTKCKLFIFAFPGIFPTYLPVMTLAFALSKMSNSSGHSLIFFKQARYCFLPCHSFMPVSIQFLPLFNLYFMTFCRQESLAIIMYLVD